jgi:hypothetical protein
VLPAGAPGAAAEQQGYNRALRFQQPLLAVVLQILWDDNSQQYVLPYKHLTLLPPAPMYTS